MRAEEDENSIGGLPFLCRFENKRGAGHMWIIWTIIIGLLAGIVAKLLMPGRDPGGFIITTLLGIAGAFVATFIGRAVGWYGENEGAQFIGAVIGAIVILAIYRMIRRRA
jgi:uncharacterized membrane protein YeaQ/YmgE (transglycosylase-associated protein family)